MMPTPPPSPTSPRICLILEGSDPFLSEGVPASVIRMVNATPGTEFAIHLIGHHEDHEFRSTQDLPPNVSSLTTSSLSGGDDPVQSSPGRGSSHQKGEFLRLVQSFVNGPDIATSFDLLCDAAVVLRQQPGMFTLADLLQSKSCWQLLSESYQKFAPQAPFIRFHATIRELATTLWNLLHTATLLPEANAYHCLSTGYAGLLGALASRLNHAPLILSGNRDSLAEHAEDVRKSPQLAPPGGLVAPFDGDPGPFKNLWFAFFNLISRIACRRASCVTALSERNAATQVKLGTSPSRVTVIPDGIDTARFAAIARENLQGGPPADGRVTVGFSGRIVPVNDIKTLIRTARLILRNRPETRFLIAGNTEENPGYAAECLALATRLGISQSIEFTGPIPPEEFLRCSHIVILTSLGEELPCSLLQAAAAGLPVVATDVGACREMISETLPNHPTLGPSGFVVPVADSHAGAHALQQLIADSDLRFEHGMNGLRRVQSAHRQEDVADQYQQLYHTIVSAPAPCKPAAQ